MAQSSKQFITSRVAEKLKFYALKLKTLLSIRRATLLAVQRSDRDQQFFRAGSCRGSNYMVSIKLSSA